MQWIRTQVQVSAYNPSALIAALGLPEESPNSSHNSLAFSQHQHDYSGRLHKILYLFQVSHHQKMCRKLRTVKSNYPQVTPKSEAWVAPLGPTGFWKPMVHPCSWLPVVHPTQSIGPECMPVQLPGTPVRGTCTVTDYGGMKETSNTGNCIDKSGRRAYTGHPGVSHSRTPLLSHRPS